MIQIADFVSAFNADINRIYSGRDPLPVGLNNKLAWDRWYWCNEPNEQNSIIGLA